MDLIYFTAHLPYSYPCMPLSQYIACVCIHNTLFDSFRDQTTPHYRMLYLNVLDVLVTVLDICCYRKIPV